MAETNFTTGQSCAAGGFKDAVCINAGRIFDSCSDKDCLEDLKVYFTPLNQSIIDNAASVKCKCVQVYTVLISVEPIVFNKGFFSVDMSFYFLVKLEASVSPYTPPVKVEGISVFQKKVILYGSEGSVNTFSSDSASFSNERGCCDEIPPKATVSVVDPVILSCCLKDVDPCVGETSFSCPECVSKLFDDEFDALKQKKSVEISIGLFSIVQLERNVQMMVPIYDYCMPEKECVSSCDDPCELFKKIKFPVNEFFPKKLDEELNEE